MRVANRYGVSPLSLAALNGNARLARLLLANGADASQRVSRGQTVLMTAARTGNADVVAALLDRGAIINAQESQLGETALMWAASENHAAVVKLLTARGADVNLRSNSLTFPKDRFGLEGVLTILPRGNWTALMYAARDGAPEAAAALLDAGAEINATDPDGTTPLVRAIWNSHYDTAKVLLERGADPNLADTADMAALYAAVDMSSLGEVYGSPPRKVKDTVHRARHRQAGDCQGRQGGREAEVAGAAAQPHARRAAAGRRDDAAHARCQERRLRGHARADCRRRRRVAGAAERHDGADAGLGRRARVSACSRRTTAPRPTCSRA